jgi:hypothetical protein
VGFLIEPHPLHGFRSAKAFVELATCDQVFELNLIKGAPFAGFHGIGFHRNPKRILVLDNIANANFIAVYFHGGTRSSHVKT